MSDDNAREGRDVKGGGVPLWWTMMREARGRSRGWLLAPALAAVGYLAVNLATVALVRQPGGVVVQPGQATSVVDVANGMVGPWWFLGLVMLGFAAAGVSAAGPGVALRRLRPDGARVRLAGWPG